MSLKIYSYSSDTLKKNDQEQMLELYHSCLQNSSYKRALAKAALFLSHSPNYLLLYKKQDLAAYIIYKRQADLIVEIWDLIVAPRFWGQSLSDHLLKYFYDNILRQGEVGELEVSKANKKAFDLYSRNHWLITRCREGYYSDASDALVLQIKKR